MSCTLSVDADPGGSGVVGGWCGGGGGGAIIEGSLRISMDRMVGGWCGGGGGGAITFNSACIRSMLRYFT